MVTEEHCSIIDRQDSDITGHWPDEFVLVSLCITLYCVTLILFSLFLYSNVFHNFVKYKDFVNDSLD